MVKMSHDVNHQSLQTNCKISVVVVLFRQTLLCLRKSQWWVGSLLPDGGSHLGKDVEDSDGPQGVATGAHSYECSHQGNRPDQVNPCSPVCLETELSDTVRVNHAKVGMLGHSEKTIILATCLLSMLCQNAFS